MVIWPALQAQAFALVLIYLIVVWTSSSLSSLLSLSWFFIVLWTFVHSSSSVIPETSSQFRTLLLARARVRQMASGGFAITISGTRIRSEIMESFVSKICMYCTIDRIIPPVDFWRF